MRRSAALAALALAGAALVACGSAPLEAHAPIFEAAPWSGPERLHYNLVQRDNLEGRCVLETVPDVAPGVTEMRRLCRDAEEGRYEDNGVVRVDSETLRPISSVRVVRDLEEGDARRFETSYAPQEGLVRFKSTEYEGGEAASGETVTAERELPLPTEETPAPAWYDDEALLWLVRGIPLREGFEGSFTNVNARSSVFSTDVTVEKREDVTVPAGAFATWKVRIETSTVTQLIWIEEAAPHRIVRARIERLTYELAGDGE